MNVKEKVIIPTTALSSRELKREFSFPFSFSSYELVMYGTYGLFLIFDITNIHM